MTAPGKQLILIYYLFMSPPYNIQQVFVYGMLGLAISMSIFLAYDFANVNKDLELQLDNVKQISQKVLEQERTANRIELERRIIEVESSRKTSELEDARDLQLSLLPKQVPKIDSLDIVKHLFNKSKEWANDTPLVDDITIVVIKILS